MASDVRFQMENSSYEDITLHINSPGGDVFEGFAIYNLLINADKPKRGVVEGLCASIATVALMACEQREMNEASMFMIHNPMSMAGGDADFLESQAEALRQIEDTLVAIYAARTGLGDTKIRNLMKDETWMNADTALSYGFINKITAAMPTAYVPANIKAVARVDPSKINQLPQIKQQMDLNEQQNSFLNRMETMFSNFFKPKNEAEEVVEKPKTEEKTDDLAAKIAELEAQLAQKDAELTQKEQEKAAIQAQMDEQKAAVDSIKGEFSNFKNSLGLNTPPDQPAQTFKSKEKEASAKAITDPFLQSMANNLKNYKK